jgi:putative transposase
MTSMCCSRSTTSRPSIGCTCAPRTRSTFATVRLRQRVIKGPGSRAAGVALAFKLIESAQRRWRLVNEPRLVAIVRAGAEFKDDKLVERPNESGGQHQAA